ncbi:MAG: acyl carrier protein [Pseudomonadota bacterium]
MSAPESLKTVIMETLIEFIGDPSKTVTEDSLLEEDLEFDSTELISVIVDIEKSLGTSLQGIKYANMKTVADIVTGVGAFLNESAEVV